MFNPGRIQEVITELRQLNVQLTRDAISMESHTDPSGLLRAAYNEAASRVNSAAVSLAACAALNRINAPGLERGSV